MSPTLSIIYYLIHILTVGLNVYVAKDDSMQEMVIKVRYEGFNHQPIWEIITEFYGSATRRGGA